MNPSLTIQVRSQNEEVLCRVTFTLGKQIIDFESRVIPPFDDEDFRDACWYFEEYPTLKGDAANLRAAQIETGLRMKGAQLYVDVFNQAETTNRVVDLIADFEVLDNLDVQIIEDAECPWIPWEMMMGPTLCPLSFDAASFVRSVDDPVGNANEAKAGLRILLVTARPVVHGESDDVPFRTISQHIVRSAHLHKDSGISIDLLRPPTFAELSHRLFEAKQQGNPYNLVHFDGHGVYRASPFSPTQKRGYLCFESSSGSSLDFVDGKKIGNLLTSAGVNAILLNACRSGYSDMERGPALNSLAGEIAQCGVGGVVAMGYSVSVRAATRLVAAMYSALSAGTSLGKAVGEARRFVIETQAIRDLDFPGILNCAIPIVFESSPVTLAPSGTPALIEIETTLSSPGTVTKFADGVFTDEAEDSLFVGYDEESLRLEQVFDRSRVVELSGVKGSGKTKLACEYARWTVLTRSGSMNRILRVDVTDFDSLEAFNCAISDDPKAFWILERLDCISWSTDLIDYVKSRPSGNTLMTSWCPSQSMEVPLVQIYGLKPADREALAQIVVPDLAMRDGFAAYLEWTQGLPGLICEATRFVDTDTLDSFEATHLHLQKLRTGDKSIAIDYAAIGLEMFDVSEVTEIVMPLALYQFKGFLGWFEWSNFASIFHEKTGIDFQISDIGALKDRLVPAMRHGLVSQIGDNGFQLHPLTPVIAEDPHWGVICALGRNDPQARVRALNLVLGSSLMTTSLVIRTSSFLQNLQGGPSSLQRNMQNLWVLVEMATEGGDIALLSLPLLSHMRDYLLTEDREAEWSSFLVRSLKGVEDSPPDPNNVENVPLLINRLLQQEMSRMGNPELAKQLVDSALQIAEAPGDRTVQKLGQPEDELDANEEPIIDLSLNSKISSLVRKGEELMNEKSAECLPILQQALGLAKDDPYRKSDILLVMARAYLNVPAIYDLEQYETFSRLALESAPPFDEAQLLNVKSSLGNAIATQISRSKAPLPDQDARFDEAETLLSLVANSSKVNAYKRASASNGLGILYRATKQSEAATEHFLRAASLFEEAGNTSETAKALANLVYSLVDMGELELAKMYVLMIEEKNVLTLESIQMLEAMTQRES